MCFQDEDTDYIRKYEHFSHVSSTDYLLQLLQLQSIDWLRQPLFQGLATSAVAGSEGLIRSSRSALVQSIQEAEDPQAAVLAIIKDMAAILGENLQDDRFAIPVLEVLAFLLDSFVSSAPDDSIPRCFSPICRLRRLLTWSSLRKLFVLVQRAHFKSSNIARLEAAVRAYAPLSRIEQLHTEVIKKMTALLLHPFPRVSLAISLRCLQLIRVGT